MAQCLCPRNCLYQGSTAIGLRCCGVSVIFFVLLCLLSSRLFVGVLSSCLFVDALVVKFKYGRIDVTD